MVVSLVIDAMRVNSINHPIFYGLYHKNCDLGDGLWHLCFIPPHLLNIYRIHVHSYVYLSIYPSIYLSVCLSVCPYIYIYTVYIYIFARNIFLINVGKTMP
jgi:hypothetical protein